MFLEEQNSRGSVLPLSSPLHAPKHITARALQENHQFMGNQQNEEEQERDFCSGKQAAITQPFREGLRTSQSHTDVLLFAFPTPTHTKHFFQFMKWINSSLLSASSSS